MATALITHPACLGHLTPPGHPERPDRLRAVLAALEGARFGVLHREAAPRAGLDAIARVHPEPFPAALLAREPAAGFARIDPDTAMSPGSGEAALRAAGAAIRGVDLVMAGKAANAFCAVRPPGHHAAPGRAMGFCLFNNVAIGAAHARAAHGLSRIAIVDFDVHHGNGTQAAFENDPQTLYLSTHQSPLFPGTGAASERGIAGNVVNVPLPPGAGRREFRAAFARRILPALDAFAPEFVLISAGFDAHHLDPLGQLALDEDDFGWATSEILALAGKHAGGRVVSTLEGGYDLGALARSVEAHVGALMEG